MEPYNIAYDIVGDRIVSTACVQCSAAVVPELMQYETIIWTNNDGQKGQMLHQIFHGCDRIAKKVHGHIIDNLRERRHP